MGPALMKEMQLVKNIFLFVAMFLSIYSLCGTVSLLFKEIECPVDNGLVNVFVMC